MTLTQAIARLAAGDKLHMQFVDGEQVWWFENPHQAVPEKIIEQLQASGDLSELGDSLFGLAGNSQSWGGGVIVSDRTPCINPRCRRTFKQEHEGEDVICGKCFRSLPAEVRNGHRRCWREYRKWDRRIKRTGDVLKAQRMHEIRDRFGDMIDDHWDAHIKTYFQASEKPAGIEAFLEEAGLR